MHLITFKNENYTKCLLSKKFIFLTSSGKSPSKKPHQAYSSKNERNKKEIKMKPK